MGLRSSDEGPGIDVYALLNEESRLKRRIISLEEQVFDLSEKAEEVRRLRAMVLRAHSFGKLPGLQMACLRWGKNRHPELNSTAQQTWGRVRAAGLLRSWARAIEAGRL